MKGNLEEELKPIFSQNENRHMNAIMNWRTDRNDDIHNMKVIGDGFKESTIILLDRVLGETHSKKGDVLIFPIMFSANHVIEVYLKVVISMQHKLQGNRIAPKLSHDLNNLLNETITNEKKINDSLGIKEIKKKLEPLRTYIDELYSKIKRIEVKGNGNEKVLYDMTYSRYANTSEKDNPAPHFYINMLENATVDMGNLREIYHTIFNDLEDLINHYSLIDESRAELESQQERELEELRNELFTN